MVVLPYSGPMGKLKFPFSLSVSTQFDLYQHQVENMLKANDIWKKNQEKLGCSASSLPVELSVSQIPKYQQT